MRAARENEALEVAEEPLESGGLARRQLLRGALWEALDSGAEVAPSLARGRERLASLGEAPLGLLGEEEAARQLETLRGWAELLRGESLQVHRFGEAPEGELAPTDLHPALVLDVPLPSGSVRVELSGFSQPQWRAGSLLLSERRAGDPGIDSGRCTLRERKEALKAYLDQVLLAAAGLGSGPHRAWICVAGGEKQRGLVQLDFPALDQGAAQDLLRAWLADALGNLHPYAIPLEAVLEDAEDLGEWVQARLDQDLGFSSTYGPLSRPEDHLPPASLDWKSLVRGRLADYLAATAGTP